MTREAEIAWAAGLFEGEGSMGAYTSRDGHHQLPLVRLAVETTDRDVLAKFVEIVGYGNVSGQRRFGRDHHKPTYRWTCSSRLDAERIIMAFYPWLGVRRRVRADEVLAEIRLLDRICEFCGSEFRAHRSDQRFCSSAHRSRAFRRTKATA